MTTTKITVASADDMVEIDGKRYRVADIRSLAPYKPMPIVTKGFSGFIRYPLKNTDGPYTIEVNGTEVFRIDPITGEFTVPSLPEIQWIVNNGSHGNTKRTWRLRS